MFSPLHVDARTHLVQSCVGENHFATRQNVAMEIRPHLFDALPIGGKLYPDDFVIAGVVVFGEINIVFPKEVIGDQPLRRMQNCREILEREKLRRRRERSRSEASNQRPFFSSQFAWRFELQGCSVFAAGFVQTASRMKLEATLIVRRRFGLLRFYRRQGESDESRGQ